jgi:hypothetical protein
MSCEKAQAIISDLYSQPEIGDCINRIVEKGPRDDFKQELFVVLLEKPCEEIVAIYDRGGIRYYVVRVILNLFNQKRNVFQKTYLSGKVDYDTEKVLYHSTPPSELNQMEERQRREDIEDFILEGAAGIDSKMGNNSFPYYEHIINSLNKYGTMRETSRQLKIPVASISMAVKRVREYLKNHL